MRKSNVARSLLMLSLIACHLPAADEARGPQQRHVRRTQLGLPTSGPMGLQDAARLPEWAQIQRITDGIRGDAAALALLRQSPAIAKSRRRRRGASTARAAAGS